MIYLIYATIMAFFIYTKAQNLHNEGKDLKPIAPLSLLMFIPLIGAILDAITGVWIYKIITFVLVMMCGLLILGNKKGEIEVLY